jgi:two-component system, OmpR family, phosphate regulon sensor histidine kinase PhoR
MVTKGMPVAFCSSDCCIGGRRRDHDQGPTDAEDDGTSLRPELLRAVDFYASILAMAAHDLRQPLQVIVGALELLSRRVTEGPAQAHLERGEQASAQLMEKLEQLADALHICRHFGKIVTEPVRVGTVVQRLGQQFGGPARGKGIDFRSLPTRAVITSQPLLLDGILRNLARNALDHTSPGGRVLVGCRRRGATVHIEVCDTGDGIPPDKLQNIFEPFFRLNTTRSAGLGLGLFIVKRAADCLGHRIEVRSAIGHGSCFSVVARSVAD